MKLDILAIAAHPGDAEASCGGTLLRMAAQGYRTGVMDMTAGEAGWYPAAEARLDETRIAGERS